MNKQGLGAGDYLSAGEVEQCRGACSDEVSILFETLLGSGLRASELCALQIRDVSLGKRRIDVRRGKGAKFRSVLIGKGLASILDKYIRETRAGAGRKDALFLNSRGGQLNYQNLHYAIGQIAKATRILHLHPHALRHTFGMFLYNYENNLEFVQKQLGHSSISTTEIYAKTFDDRKLPQMDGFEAMLDGAKPIIENTSKLWKDAQEPVTTRG